MKRFLKNLLLWLLVIVLAVVLYFKVNPAKVQQVSQMLSQVMPTPVATVDEESQVSVSELMEEKKAIEVQLKALQQEIAEVKAAPSTVMILFSTLEENMIREASVMMDQLGMTGVLGLSAEELSQWIEKGIPEYVQSRLDAEWELCFVLEEDSVETMQSQLEELQLPHAVAAYILDNRYMDMESLANNGISIVLDDGMRPRVNDDTLWHVPAIGSMNSNGLVVYESKRNTGAAVVYIAGNLHGDQQYIKENFEALLMLVADDRKAGTVQNLQLLPAMTYCLKHDDKIAQYQATWDQREAELQEQLTTVLMKIGAVGQ